MKAGNPWKGEKRQGRYGVLTCIGATDDRKYVVVRYKHATPHCWRHADWTALPPAVKPPAPA